ncbi:hypothetical protein H312_03144 [Anncaliia algerae PRA339]|uniref:Uncharacterized protein n=1 Tax=Anncaliia algerae PRA339 TaxID=1288291 RepID=A0A059EX32_9MICR|nr:hypothetical protein H312_03144 [Anncaliia algerae PRA339]
MYITFILKMNLISYAIFCFCAERTLKHNKDDANFSGDGTDISENGCFSIVLKFCSPKKPKKVEKERNSYDIRSKDIDSKGFGSMKSISNEGIIYSLPLDSNREIYGSDEITVDHAYLAPYGIDKATKKDNLLKETPRIYGNALNDTKNLQEISVLYCEPKTQLLSGLNIKDDSIYYESSSDLYHVPDEEDIYISNSEASTSAIKLDQECDRFSCVSSSSSFTFKGAFVNPSKGKKGIKNLCDINVNQKYINAIQELTRTNTAESSRQKNFIDKGKRCKEDNLRRDVCGKTTRIETLV